MPADRSPRARRRWWGDRVAAAPAVLKERDAGVFDFPWSDAANYGAGVSKSWNRVWICSLFSANRCRTGSPFPVTKPFLKRAGLILLTKIDADLAAV